MDAPIPSLRWTARFALSLACAGACACARDRKEDVPMKEPQAGYETNPRFYKLNSVRGEVLCDDRPVPGARITIVQSGESVPVEETGSFVLVLDPEVLGTREHELLFSAPGYVEQRHKVVIPENNQTSLFVTLERVKK